MKYGKELNQSFSLSKPLSSAPKKNNHTAKIALSYKKLNTSKHQRLLDQQVLVPRERWIAEAAYYKAQARGFVPGHELNDWFASEEEYRKMLVERFLSNCREDGCMTITGLCQLAMDLGVAHPERFESKVDLIRAIQVASHQQPCFRVNVNEFCNQQAECPWSSECKKLIAEWYS